MSARASIAGLAALLLGVACSPSSEGGARGPAGTGGGRTETSATAMQLPGEPLPELLDQARVAHLGERLVELFDAGGLRTLAYRERVASDGAGAFSLRTLEALTPVPQDWLPRQWNREGYLFRYRDFAIRRPAWFQANYTVTGPEAAGSVAGREVERYRVERRPEVGGEVGGWDLWVDRASRLPLRIEERGPRQELRSRVEYTSLELAPDADELANVAWFRGVHDERALDEEAPLDEQVGYAVPTPRLLPAGYRLHAASTLRDRDHAWVKLTYTDGAETFFFLHQGPEAETPGKGPRTAPNAAGQGPGTLVLPESRAAGDLFLHRLGAAGVAQATLDEGTFLAVGKVSDDELVDAIESALP